MAIVRVAEDVEAGVVGAGGGGAGCKVTEPLLRRCGKEEEAEPNIRDEAEASECGSQGRLQADDGGSLRMVLVSTAVAVCGSFEFGTCVSHLLLNYVPFKPVLCLAARIRHLPLGEKRCDAKTLPWLSGSTKHCLIFRTSRRPKHDEPSFCQLPPFGLL
jgi:hypothetical protein